MGPSSLKHLKAHWAIQLLLAHNLGELTQIPAGVNPTISKTLAKGATWQWNKGGILFQLIPVVIQISHG